MHGLKYGSCRIWRRTDLPPGSNMHGLKSGSCRFWHRTDLPPDSNMLRLAYADSGSACKLAGVQIIPLPTVANQILARTLFKSVCCPRWRIKFSFERCPDPSRISLRPQPLESSLGRVSQAADGTCKKFRKPDRVGRRGLSEPGGIFSRLLTDAWTQIWFVQILAVD